MANTLPPPPTVSPSNSIVWLEWYRQLRNFLVAEGGTIPWTNVSKTGSNLTDLATRTHNSLQSIQGGATSDYYHLTGTQATDLTDSGFTTLHNHLIRPTYFVPTTLTVTTGTLTTGTVSNLIARGGTTVVITEVTGTPGFDVKLDFSGVISPLAFVLEGYYNGSTSHTVDLSAYNYTTSAWDRYTSMGSTTAMERYNNILMLSSDYVSGGAARIRMYHSSAGTAGHTLNLDFAAFVSLETY